MKKPTFMMIAFVALSGLMMLDSPPPVSARKPGPVFGDMVSLGRAIFFDPNLSLP